MLSALLLLSLASDGQIITLDSVLRVIDQRHPMLKDYDQRIEAQQAYAAGAKSWMAPMVGVGTFMTPYPGQSAEEADRGSFMLSIEQNIPNPAKLSANERHYASRAAVEEQGRAVRFNALRAEAKTAYYKWLVAEKKQEVLRESENIVGLMIKLANARYPYNQTSLGSIYKAEGRLHEIQNMILMTSGEIEEAAYVLRSVMNLPAETPLMVDTAMTVRFDMGALGSDTALLRTHRSDIRQLDKSIEMMRLSRELQQFQSRPDFRFRFDHMQPLGSGMPTQFTAMAMISIPIAPWSSKMYKSETKGMTHDIEAMKREQDALVLETRGMLTGMTAQLARMEQQLNNYRTKIIPALRKNYEAVMVSYEENRASLPAVLDSWEALNMSQLEYTEKQQEYLAMIVKYEKEVER